MNAETIIAEIRKLPLEDLKKVGAFLYGYLSDLDADKVSAQRAAELTSGTVQPLSHEEVFKETDQARQDERLRRSIEALRNGKPAKPAEEVFAELREKYESRL